MYEKKPGQCPELCTGSTILLLGHRFENGEYIDTLKCYNCGTQWEEFFRYDDFEGEGVDHDLDENDKIAAIMWKRLQELQPEETRRKL